MALYYSHTILKLFLFDNFWESEYVSSQICKITQRNRLHTRWSTMEEKTTFEGYGIKEGGSFSDFEINSPKEDGTREAARWINACRFKLPKPYCIREFQSCKLRLFCYCFLIWSNSLLESVCGNAVTRKFEALCLDSSPLYILFIFQSICYLNTNRIFLKNLNLKYFLFPSFYDIFKSYVVPE